MLSKNRTSYGTTSLIIRLFSIFLATIGLIAVYGCESSDNSEEDQAVSGPMSGTGVLPTSGTGVLPTSGTGVLPTSGTGVLPQAGASGAVAQSGTGGMTTPASGTGGAIITGGSGGSTPISGSGGSTPISGSGGESVDAGPPEDPCTATQWTEATAISVDISWEGTFTIEAGAGKLNLWTKTDFTAGETAEDGTTPLTGKVQVCGSEVPPITKTAIAAAISPGQIMFDFTDATWDSPAMPRFDVTGQLTGEVADGTTTVASITAVGVNLDDPRNFVWPESYTELENLAYDADGDGFPGITGIVRGTDPYGYIPVAVGGPNADKIYVAVRTILDLAGTRLSCTEEEGTATVSNFDNHVMGCHVENADECIPNQTAFVDENRTIYQLSGGTYKSTRIHANATCEEVRAANVAITTDGV